MKRLIIIGLTFFLVIPLSAFAEIKTVTHIVQQPFGGSQSPDDARTAGVARAKREALEQFGTYIESTTIVKNSLVDSDEILSLTAGVTKTEVIKQKNYTEGEAFGIEITVKVELDTDVLDKSLKRLLVDRKHLKDLTAARSREKQLLARIAELEKQSEQKGKSKQQSAKLKKEFHVASQRLAAVEWFSKALALWNGNKISDPKKAIEYFSQAIRLDPKFTVAYNNRGNEYINLKQLDLAISDFDKAIQLDTNFAGAYYNRGIVNYDLKQFNRAISDYDQAIRLDPNMLNAFYNRGVAFSMLHQLERAIKDFDQAILLNPDYLEAYGNRGTAYAALNQFERAITDYDKVIQLDTNVAGIYFERGVAYAALNQFDRAITDFDRTIRLKPNDALAYNNRGSAYIELNNGQKGCGDLKRACELGKCDAYEYAMHEKICK